MKTLGLIGGMSWESSAVYYELINERVKRQLGGLHSCQSLMYSVDFAPILELMEAGEWGQITAKLVDCARRIEKTGADSPAKMGLIMKEVMPEVKGKADGKLVNKIAAEMLSKPEE